MEEQQYEKILAWLEGSLTQEEQDLFALAMKNDPALAKEVSLVKATLTAQNEPDVAALRKNLQSIMAEPVQTKQANRSKPLLLIIIVLLAVILLYWLLPKGEESQPPAISPSTPIALYEQYYPIQKLPVPINVVRDLQSGSNPDSLKNLLTPLLAELNQAVIHGEKEVAAQALQQIKATDPTRQVLTSSGLALLEGVVLLQQGSPDESLPYFAKAEENRPDELAQWYRAGAYLRMGKTQEARSALEVIINQPMHPKRQEAAQIIKQLPPDS